ncbi:SAR2788 family putative toxin [Gracilibacillus sp. S3-1-1]|uniref:SAR2788 family putative toxin n=1 Tax=Gracilibacillus pellucidus TaxID=3095368 RepID=A0ACC6M474_9BACI|nr:SAR2788 family putative toxin [Gracilibacillus sp. S3-1-1]MDX8045706.1 SAR2788 family putative toxin [Gracilibacillus sp. S3-1-1]
MKKILISLIILSFVINTATPAFANTEVPSTDEINSYEVQEVATNHENDLVQEVLENKDEIVVENTLVTNDFDTSVDVILNKETENIEVHGKVEEDGIVTEVNLDVNLIEFSEEDDIFIAIFTDLETGQQYTYDSTELKASILPAVPVVVGFIVRFGVKQAVKHFGKNTLRQVSKNMAKADSPVWKKLKPFRGKTKTDGSGKKKRYYEWDNTHNDIEVYDNKGKHLGSMDPLTGEMYKGPVRGRTINL